MCAEAGPAKSRTLSYDPYACPELRRRGNRTQDAVGVLTVKPGSNQLDRRHGVQYQYDNAGNVTFDGTYTYTYNARGQASQITQGATVVATYHYDYRHRRTRKVTAQGTTVYHDDQ